MPISNCIRCGSVFSRTNKFICADCLRKEEADFQKIADWLRDNPGQTIQALSEATGIEKREILRWIRENRLILMDASEFLQCKKCGTLIPAGNFCDRCKLELTQEVGENIKEMEKEIEGQRILKEGMHYAPSKREKKKTYWVGVFRF